MGYAAKLTLSKQEYEHKECVAYLCAYSKCMYGTTDYMHACMHAYENTRSGLCLRYLYTHLVASESSQSDDTQTRPSQELAPTMIRMITNIILQSKYTIIMIIFITEWSTQATPVVVTPCTELAGSRVPLTHMTHSVFSPSFSMITWWA